MTTYMYGHLPPGTRVTHKRYPNLVGTVIEPMDDTTAFAMVTWTEGVLWPETRSECWSELRATPVQP